MNNNSYIYSIHIYINIYICIYYIYNIYSISVNFLLRYCKSFNINNNH